MSPVSCEGRDIAALSVTARACAEASDAIRHLQGGAWVGGPELLAHLLKVWRLPNSARDFTTTAQPARPLTAKGRSSAAPRRRAWARSAWEAIRQHSAGGSYVNLQAADEDDRRVREAYGQNLDRLASVKATYDPHNLFRVNRNIRPTKPIS